MMKMILGLAAMVFALASWAAVDVNKATDAELEGIKGVGPSLSKRILEAREQGAFKDWPDFMARVKGVKEKSATKLSVEGLTVNGKPFDAAPAAAAPAATPPAASAAASPAPAKAAPATAQAKSVKPAAKP